MSYLSIRMTLKWYRFKNWFRLKWKWLTGRKVTRATVIADAKSIHKGAVVLFEYNEMIKFSYEVLIREKIFKERELVKFIERGDRVLRKRFKNENRKQEK